MTFSLRNILVRVSVIQFSSSSALTHQSGSITKLLSTVWQAATNQSVFQVLHLCVKSCAWQHSGRKKRIRNISYMKKKNKGNKLPKAREEVSSLAPTQIRSTNDVDDDFSHSKSGRSTYHQLCNKMLYKAVHHKN